MRRTNKAAFIEQFGGSPEALKIVEEEIRQRTVTLNAKSAAQMKNIEETLVAAVALATTLEQYERSKARFEALRSWRKRS